MFFLKDRFQSGFQTDARKLIKPQDALNPYRCIISNKKQITLFNNTYEFNDDLQVVPTIWFSNFYYEKKANLANPEIDDGRRELHAKFNLKEYPFIMTALKEMKSQNPELFKNIPDCVPDLKTTTYESDTDEDENAEEYESPIE